MLPPIPVDRLAIRPDGKDCVGWIIIYKCEQGKTHSDVRNAIFPTEESAVAWAKSVHPDWMPIVKALRR